MKWILMLVLAISMTNCGGLALPQIDSLTSLQPQVISVEPEDGSTVSPVGLVTLSFSVPVEPVTVDARSFIIKKMEEGEDAESEEDIIDDATDGRARGIDGVYVFSDDGTAVTFVAESPYNSGDYLVIATNQVLSVEMLPLSQHPGRATSPFVSGFTVTANGTVSGSSSAGAADGGSGNDGGDGESDVARNRPGNLIINEILYDVPGSDTDGDVFIELVGDAGGDITGYKLYLVNGEDGVIKDTIKISENAIIPDDGIFLIADAKTGQSEVSDVVGADLVDNFDPQNGPDCIQLVDENDTLLDAIGYGEPIIGTAENGLACFEGTPTPKVSSGQSLSRTGGIDTGNNSSDFSMLEVPAPGLF